MFGVQDLFVVGIGFDIAGAVLVAQGLLASPGELALRTAITWNGNPAATASQVEDRLRGSLGLTALVVGFGLQAVAYGITVELADPSSGSWVGVLVAGVLPVLVVLAVDRLTWTWRLKRLLVEVARYSVNEGTMKPRPSAERLVGLAKACGLPDLEGRTPPQYALDEFGVGTDP